MIIKNIKLHNFRNYTDCSVQLAENINVFIGDNAQGKTNLKVSLLSRQQDRFAQTMTKR